MPLLPKLSVGFKRVVAATAAHLRSPDRAESLKYAAQQWTFMHEARQIPGAYPHELWPTMREQPVPVPVLMETDSELPLGERVVLAGLVAAKQPRTIFEFGTFTGTTTRLLADVSSPDAHIHTIDLPAEQYATIGLPGSFTPDQVGRHFVGDDAYRDRITLHRSDIQEFDFGPYLGRVDLVFVDADHTYDGVLKESALALRLVAPGGTIVWDDYQATQWAVVRALNELAATTELHLLAHTRFVVYEAGPATS